MKNIIFTAVLMLIIPSSISFSQNDYETYKQPEIMQGSNLIFTTSPNFSASNEVSYSADVSNNYFYLNGGLLYTKWRLTPKFNYSFSAETNLGIQKQSTDFILLSNSDLSSGDDEYRSYLRTYFEGGISYYFLKKLFYTGIYTRLKHNISNKQTAYSSFSAYPALGMGYLINTARVTPALNIQQVLLDEKIISAPLPEKTRKKIVELLDKQNEGEFLSRFKDDADIEFFSRIEQVLRDDGVITGNLDTRTVLKLFQALTNEKFIYFPNYNGWQVQAELQLNLRNYGDENDKNKLRSFTLSAIYGRPIGLKNNFTGSVFFTVPVKPDYLYQYYRHDFHSPVTLLEHFSGDLDIPYLENIEYRDTVKYSLSTRLNFYQLINKTAGIYFTVIGNYAKIQHSYYRSSFSAEATLVYNLLNKLVGTVNAGFKKNYYLKYGLFVRFDISYYIF